MALKIRLRQQGRKNRVVYRLVLTDVGAPRDGKYMEMLGWYNPHQVITLDVKGDRVFYWLNQGAEITEKAIALIKKGAPGVYEAYTAKKLARRASLCRKRRAYRQRLSAGANKDTSV